MKEERHFSFPAPVEREEMLQMAFRGQRVFGLFSPLSPGNSFRLSRLCE